MIRMSVEEYQETQDRLKGLPASQPAIIGNRVEKKKPSKHRNVRVRIDSINFASKVEGRRYQQLKFLEDQGLISDLRCQVSFELAPAVHLAGRHRMSPPLRYFADFVYEQGGKVIVEDVKGQEKVTEGFRIKRHLMATVHGINIVEIRRGGK